MDVRYFGIIPTWYLRAHFECLRLSYLFTVKRYFVCIGGSRLGVSSDGHFRICQTLANEVSKHGEQSMIGDWLESLGLGKYAQLFTDNEIDFDTLCGLTEKDLADLGLGFGPRRKLLNALAAKLDAANIAPSVLPSLPTPTETTSPIPTPTVDGERRQLTVLFCDMVGFTELASRVDPEVLQRVIRAYEDACALCVTRYEGYVFQRLGDGVVAFFGYPVAHEGEAERAINAGLAIIDSLAKLAVPEAGYLRVRIGIASGLVVVSSAEKGAWGETMNLASRLQGIAPVNSIVVSEQVWRIATHAFSYEDLGSQTLKGMTTASRAYRVVEAIQPDSPAGTTSRGRISALVGRSQEIGLLLDRWDRVMEGSGQVVLVIGEPGIGKSRLLRALDEETANQSHARLELRCSPYFSQTPLYPLVERLPRRLDWKAGDSHEEETEKLSRFLREMGMPLEESLPLLMQLLSRPTPAHFPLPSMSPERQRRRTLETLAALPIAMSKQQPVVLAIEDLHWADPTTLDLVGRHIEQAPTARMLLLLTARPGFEPPWGTKSYLTPVVLNRLTRRQSEEFVQALAEHRTLPSEVARQLLEKSDGVPLFVEELTRSVLESDLLRQDGERYVLVGKLNALSIPATLQDSLMARLDRMGAAKEVAQWGATIGRDFDFELIRQITGQDSGALIASLNQLTHAEILFQRGAPPEASYTFKHALVRDAAYQALLKSTRQKYHERTARVMAESFSALAAQRAEFVAHHFTEAGLIPEAINWWRNAGQRAASNSGASEAAAHFRKAIDLLAQLPPSGERDHLELGLQLMLGMELVKRLGWGAVEVMNVFSRARALSGIVDDPRARYVAMHILAANLHVQGDLLAAEQLHGEGLKLALSIGDPDLILGGNMGVGFVAQWQGRFDQSRACLEQVISQGQPERADAYLKLYALHPVIVSMGSIAYMLGIQGFQNQAQAMNRKAVDEARSFPHTFTLTYTLMLTGYHYLMRREEVSALPWLDEALKLCNDQEFILLEVWLNGFHGMASAMMGHYEAAIPVLQKCVSIAESMGAALSDPIFLTHLAQARAASGQIPEALRDIERALSIADTQASHQYLSVAHRTHGDILLGLDSVNFSGAEQAYLCALDVARTQSAKTFELQAAMSLARFWSGQGKRQAGLNLLAPVFNWFTEGFDTLDLRDAKHLLSELAS